MGEQKCEYNSKSHLDGCFFFIVIKHFCNKISVWTEMTAAGRTDGRMLFRGRVVRFINFAVGDFTAFCVVPATAIKFSN